MATTPPPSSLVATSKAAHCVDRLHQILIWCTVHTSDAFQCINKAMLGASLVVVQPEPLVFGAKPPKSTPSLLYLPFVLNMKRIRAH